VRIKVAELECAGHGQCALVNAELFRLDDDGFSALQEREVPPELHDDARRGVQACPSRAISITDD
jgi:ferredoxin